MSETAITHTGGGAFATARRGGIDEYERAFIHQRRERRVPVQHIANMLGRNVADVALYVSTLTPAPEPPPPPRVRKNLPIHTAIGTTEILDAIVDDVEIRHELALGSVLGRGMSERVIAARFEAYWLARQVLNHKGQPRFSFPLLAKFFGRDHTTISGAITKMRARGYPQATPSYAPVSAAVLPSVHSEQG